MKHRGKVIVAILILAVAVGILLFITLEPQQIYSDGGPVQPINTHAARK